MPEIQMTTVDYDPFKVQGDSAPSSASNIQKTSSIQMTTVDYDPFALASSHGPSGSKLPSMAGSELKPSHETAIPEEFQPYYYTDNGKDYDNFIATMPQSVQDKANRAIGISAALDVKPQHAFDLEAAYTAMHKDDPMIQKLGRAVKGGFGQTYSAMGSYLKSKGMEGKNLDDFIEYGERLQRANMNVLPRKEFEWSDVLNFEYLATNLAEMTPIWGTLAVSAIVANYVAAPIAGALQLGRFGKGVLMAIGGSALATPMESAFEAGSAYQDAIKRGESHDDARLSADNVFSRNMALLGLTNFASLGMAFVPLNLFGKAADTVMKKRISSVLVPGARVIGVVGSEGGQERYQEIIQMEAAGEEAGFFDLDNARLNEATALGAIFGLGMGGVGSVWNALTTEVTKELPDPLKKVYEEEKKYAKASGLTEQQAELKALDAVAETEEGQKHIEQVIAGIKAKIENPDFTPEIQEDVQEEDEAPIPEFNERGFDEKDKALTEKLIAEGREPTDEELDELIYDYSDAGKIKKQGPITADQARSLFAPFAEVVSRSGHKIEFHNSLDEMPDSIEKRKFQEDEQQTGRRIMAAYVQNTDTSHILTDGAESMNDVLREVLHESIGHAGLYKFMGEELNPFLDYVLAHPKYGEQVKKVAKERGIDFIKIATRRQAAKEWFAGIAEREEIQPTLMTRLIVAFKNALRRMGIKSEMLTGFSDSDIAEIIRGSRAAISGRNVRAVSFGKGAVDYQDGYHSKLSDDTIIITRKEYIVDTSPKAKEYKKNVQAIWDDYAKNTAEFTNEAREAAYSKSIEDGVRYDKEASSLAQKRVDAINALGPPPSPTVKLHHDSYRLNGIKSYNLSNPNDLRHLLKSISSRDGYIGIRGIYATEIGKKRLKPSSVWVDNTPTSQKLPGTSVLFVGETSDFESIEDLKKLIKNDTAIYGEIGISAIIFSKELRANEINADKGEAVFPNAQVLGYIDAPILEAEGQVDYQDVFHGTPHVWPPEPGFPHGRPRLDKIGTGEGAASFGWGWYSAEGENTAKHYKVKLSDETYLVLAGERLSDIYDNAHEKYGDVSGEMVQYACDNGLADALDLIDTYLHDPDAKRYYGDDVIVNATDKELRSALALLKKVKRDSDAQLYKLDIPDSVIPKLLDWDKPLSKQSEYVKKILRPELKGNRYDVFYGKEKIATAVNEMSAKEYEDRGMQVKDAPINWRSKETGESFYKKLNGNLGTVKAASEYLASIGIPGNKYLDGMSRGKGEGSYNYVIWDQAVLDKIALLERNGEKLDAMREAEGQVDYSDAPKKPEESKSAKTRIRAITGQTRTSPPTQEHIALREVMRKSMQASVAAYRAGKHDAVAKLAEERKAHKIAYKEKQKAEQAKRAAIKNIQKMQKKMGGKIAVDYQKRINALLSGLDFKKPTAAKLKELEGLKNYIEAEGVPLEINPRYLKELGRLSKVPIRDFSAEDAVALEDTVNRLYELGKLKNELKLKYDERERTKALKALIADTKNVDVKVKDKAKLTRAEEFRLFIKSYYMNTLHSFRVADMFDGFGGYAKENAKIIKMLGAKANSATFNAGHEKIAALEKIKAIGVETITEDQEVRMMINMRAREGARAQVLTLLKHYKLTEVPKLTETEEAILAIIQSATNKLKPRLAATFEELNNEIFPELPVYYLPLKYAGEDQLIPDTNVLGGYRTTHTFQGMTHSRVSGVQKLPRVDLVNILSEALDEQHWYVEMEPELENIKQILFTPEYKAAGGEMAQAYWRDQLDIIARRGWSNSAKNNAMSAGLRKIRHNMNDAVLLFKASTILMQPFAVFDAAAYANSKWGPAMAAKVLAETTKTLVSPSYAKSYIETSSALQLRQGGELAIEEELAQLKDSRMDKIKKFGYGLISKADVRTAAGVQSAVEKMLVSEGVENPKAEAEFFMDLMNGSSNVVYRPHILSTGEGARTFFTFQSFIMNRWGIIAHDIVSSGLVNDPSFKKKAYALISIGILMMAGLAEDEARKVVNEFITQKEFKGKGHSALFEAIMNLASTMPGIGAILNTTVTGGSASPPAIRTAEKAVKGLYRAGAGKDSDAQLKGLFDASEGVLSLYFGLPGTAQMYDLAEGQMFNQ